MRYRYKDPLGYEREYDGDMDDILDFIEETKVIDNADRIKVRVGDVKEAIQGLDDDQIVIISSCNK